MKTTKEKTGSNILPKEIVKSKKLIELEKQFYDELGYDPDWEVKGPFVGLYKFSSEIMNINKDSKKFGASVDEAKIYSLMFIFDQILKDE